MTRFRSAKYYPDIPVFLIIIPFIAAFNYYLTYKQINFDGFLLMTFTIDTVQGYAAWLGVRQIILYLDENLAYDRGLLSRLVVQLPLTTLAGLAIIALSTELASFLYHGRRAPIDFYTFDLVIISIWFFVINGFYIVMHFYRKWQLSESKLQTRLQVRQEGLKIKAGSKNILIRPDELQACYVDQELVSLVTREGRRYVWDLSLDKLENMLPPEIFFRTNRQTLISRDLIRGFSRLENGKLLILVHSEDTLPGKVIVSRTKAPQFKRWWNSSH